MTINLFATVFLENVTLSEMVESIIETGNRKKNTHVNKIILIIISRVFAKKKNCEKNNSMKLNTKRYTRATRCTLHY